MSTDDDHQPGQSLTRKVILRSSLWLGTITATAIIVACTVVFCFGVVIGRSIAGIAFNVPFIVYPVTWAWGVISVWRKHRSLKIAVTLTIIGVCGFALLPVLLYVVVILVVGGWQVK